MRNRDEIDQWLAIRKREALNIDPETAEFDWSYEYIVDPYHIYDDLTEEEKQVGRVYFTRRPGSDIWVGLYDVPDEARDRLWERIDEGIRRKTSARVGNDNVNGCC
jgi:hypothetical protein